MVYLSFNISMCYNLLTSVYYVLELEKMGCPENDTSLDITIPVVLMSKSDGDNIKKYLDSGGRGAFLYS